MGCSLIGVEIIGKSHSILNSFFMFFLHNRQGIQEFSVYAFRRANTDSGGPIQIQ